MASKKTASRGTTRQRAAANNASVVAGSGNVFVDLGCDDAEARVMAMRAEVMIRIELQLKSRGWTHGSCEEAWDHPAACLTDQERGLAGVQSGYPAEAGGQGGTQTRAENGRLMAVGPELVARGGIEPPTSAL